MPLSLVSWIALACIAAALVAGFSKRFVASGALLLANLAVFLLAVAGPTHLTDWSLGPVPVVNDELALHPQNLLHLQPLGFLQLFTSMFAHANLLHFAGNFIVLWAFGVPFEERIGHRKFLAIYLASGLAGSVLQFALDANGIAPSLGASGAIFGIMGAFAYRFGRQVIAVPVPVGLFMMRIPMRVLTGAIIYTGYQIFDIFWEGYSGISSGIGFAAHLGGLASGMVLAAWLVKPGTPQGSAPVPVDLGALAPFARDPKTKRVLDHMLHNHDEPAVFQAWLDSFFRTATCPTCTHKVMPKAKGEVICTEGHRFDVRQATVQATA